MGEVIRATLGGHVPIRIFARERRSDSLNGRLFDVDGLRVASITRPDGTLVAGANIPALAHVARGEYVAQWNTGPETQAGPYTVRIEAGVGWDTVAAVGLTAPKNVIVLLNKAGGVP